MDGDVYKETVVYPINWFVLHTGDSLTGPTSDHQDKYTTHFWILNKTET